MWVRDQQAELGNNYFECMLKKAKAKKEQGDFDASLKQASCCLMTRKEENISFLMLYHRFSDRSRPVTHSSHEQIL